MLRIAHLSDIHLSESNLSDLKEFIVKPLLQDLIKFHKEQKIDLIIFTGDLIDKGGNGNDPTYLFLLFEEAVIEPIVNTLKISKHDCFFVPGNHDMVRSADKIIEETGLTAILSNIDAVNHHIESGDLTGIQRTISFKEFEKFYYKDFDTDKMALSNYQSCFIKEVREHTVAISCFNSAWRSYDSDKDKGKLLIGEKQIINAEAFLDKSDIKLAIMHHPLDWFSEFEESYTTPFITDKYNLLFTGHVHQGSAWAKTDVYGNIMVSAAPANWKYAIHSDSRKNANGYSIIDLDINIGKTVVYHRRYTYSKRCYDPNADLGNEYGVKEFTITGTDQQKRNVKEIELTTHIQKVHLPTINEHLISFNTDTCAPKEIENLFVFPGLISRLEYDREKKEERIETIEEVCLLNENVIIFGTKEAGKTLLIDKLLIEHSSGIRRFHTIPVVIDFNNIENRIETLISRYLGIGILEIENFLNNHKVVLLVDNITFEKANEHNLKKLENLLQQYNQVRLVAVCSKRIPGELPVELFEYPFYAKCRILHISEFKSKHIKQLIQNWFSTNKKNVTVPKIERILKTFMALNLPRTPLAISMFLWIIEQQEAYKPINQAAMLEDYIEKSFEKHSRTEILSSEFDFYNKQFLLADIAVYMLDNNKDNYCIFHNDLIVFISEYLKKKKFSFEADKILNHFIKVGILMTEKINGDMCIRFRFNCFFQYYLTKKMDYSQTFKDYVLDEKNFLRFIDEIDYYTGLHRNQIKILEEVLQRMSREYTQLLSAIHELPTKFDTQYLQRPQDSIAGDYDIQKIKLRGKPSEKEIEEMQDEMLASLPVEDGVGKKADDITPISRLDKLWLLACKVLKNTEEIEESDLKAQGLKEVIVCGMAFACLYKSYLEHQLAKYQDTMHPKIVENMHVLSKYMPLAFEVVLYTLVGTGKLAVILKEKIDTEIKSKDVSDFEKFVSVFLYADIRGDNYLYEIKRLIGNINNSYVYDLAIFKVFTYYVLRSKTEDMDNKLLQILADIKIALRHDRKSSKDRIMKDYQELKNKEYKEIAELGY